MNYILGSLQINLDFNLVTLIILENPILNNRQRDLNLHLARKVTVTAVVFTYQTEMTEEKRSIVKFGKCRFNVIKGSS